MVDSDPQFNEADTAAEALRVALEHVRARLELASDSTHQQPSQAAALKPILEIIEALNLQLTAYTVQQGTQHGAGAVLARVQLASMLHGCRYWLDLMDLQLIFMREHQLEPEHGSEPIPDLALVDALGQHLQRLSGQWDRQMRVFHTELETLFDQLRDGQSERRHHRVKP
jgi:hypothetical protein